MAVSFGLMLTLCLVGVAVAGQSTNPVPSVAPAAGVTAQRDVPTLSDVQKLLLLNAWKDVEIARLKFQALVKDVQKDGYDLDVESMTYREQKAKP